MHLKSEEKSKTDLDFEMIYQYANDSMIIHDATTGKILEVNERSCELYGRSKEEILKLSVGDLSIGNHKYNQKKAIELIKKSSNSNKILTFDWVVKHADGRVIPVEANLKRIEGTSPPLILGMARDISQRKALEKKIKNQKLYYKRLIGVSSDGIALIDKDGILKYVSPSVKNIIGFPARCCIKENIIDYLDEKDGFKIFKLLSKAKQKIVTEGSISYRIKNSKGEWRNHESSFKNHLDKKEFGYIIINFRDVTDRLRKEEEEKNREQQLNHFWRLTIAGEVSAAMAHEVNQPLCAARNYIAGYRRRIETNQLSPNDLNDGIRFAEKELDRAANIIKSLRNFTRNSPMNIKKNTLSDVLNDILAFIEIRCKENSCQLKIEIIDNDYIYCDSTLIQQVITNIVINAIEAMEENTLENSEISIKTFKKENQMYLSVTDTGGNLPFNNIDELPGRFFTTKDSGVGLGLSLCRSIISAHHGFFNVERKHNPEKSCFYFSLPINKSDKTLQNK
ncbi:hypothetical protein C0J08_17975 [Marinomonas sp. CT5]|uniref:PAS domain S-box protein n=1 Tax=Marinomonas sp. CT5 TaxID=2066133 RepID=UPI001BAE62CD|nr:PAS domain S-box protein [Marinomonas sp. CT5]QUX97162.1 hypothetical protein C0J08_17975 [Marinomonas sp. CT5]